MCSNHDFAVLLSKWNQKQKKAFFSFLKKGGQGKFLPLAFPFFRSLIFGSIQSLKLKSYHLSNYTFLITNRSFDLLLSKFSCNRWKLKISHFILFSNHNFFSAVQVDFFNIISMFSHFNSHVTTTQPQTSFFSAIL